MEDIEHLLGNIPNLDELLASFANDSRNSDVNFHILTRTDDIDQTWTVLRIITERPPKGWEKLFKLPGIIAGAKRIDHRLEEEFQSEYVPLRRHLFRAYNIPLSDVRVVIIGQDPYYTSVHGRPQATGWAFSLWRDAPLQPSLRNIYKQIGTEYPSFQPPNHGDLTGWVNQGVFLLNACFTTSPGLAGAHKELWRDFVKQTIQLIREERPATVVMLWGGAAQKLGKDCGNLKLVMCSHPSDKSAYSGDTPFMGSGCFTKCNQHLISQGIEPIDWTHLP